MPIDEAAVAIVSEDLIRRFGGTVPEEVVRAIAQDCLAQWPDARIRDFVPILAAKLARERLATQYAPAVQASTAAERLLAPAAG